MVHAIFQLAYFTIPYLRLSVFREEGRLLLPPLLLAVNTLSKAKNKNKLLNNLT